jgi:hypothetical protein
MKHEGMMVVMLVGMDKHTLEEWQENKSTPRTAPAWNQWKSAEN